MERAVRFENKEDSENEENIASKVPRKSQHALDSCNSTKKEAKPKIKFKEGNSKSESVESLGRWRAVSKQIRNAVTVKNAVKPSRTRRRSTWKSPSTVDPFLQKFSTRDNRKISPPNRKKSKASKSSSTDNVLPRTDDNNDAGSTTIEIEKEPDSELTSGSIYEYDHVELWKDKRIVFDPDGIHICVWFYVLVFAIRYNLWALIVRIAFPEAQTGWLKIAWFLLDYFCDAIYALDVAISARTGYLEEGILVTDPKLVCMRYIRSAEFFADVASLLPTDILYAAFGPLPHLRLNRIIKAYKSFRIKSVMESLANYPTFLRVFFLMHLMFLLIHWNAGFYIMVSRFEGLGSNDWVYEGNGSLYQQYLQSFYWSTLTLTAIGDLPKPATNLEYVYTTACYLTGVFMFATIVGNAGSIIVNRNAVRMDFEKQRENTKQYMKKHNVPKDLQRRVVMWYDYSWARGRMSTGGGDLNSLTLLPNKLKTEIALHVNLETLRKVTFLQKCQPEFLHDLVLKMKLRIFTPGDLVCRKGEVAREMYVIIDGKIEVIGDQGQVLKVLSGGDFFGEIGILSLSEGQNRRTADVRTIGYVECFVLSKEDVLSAIRDYPEAQAVLAEYGKKRLERQNSSQDPRLVDMEDNEKERENYSPDTIDAASSPRILKRDSLQCLAHNNKRNSDSMINFLPNGQCKRKSLTLEPISQRSGRSVFLEPIPQKLRRGRRVSSDTVIQSAQTAYKSDSDVSSNSDELIAKMFSNTCTEALTFLKKVFDEKLAKEVKNNNKMLKNMEEQSKQKDERISHLRDCLTTAEKELDECRKRVKELESENYINEQTIRKLQDQSEDVQKRGREAMKLYLNILLEIMAAEDSEDGRSRTMSSTVSSSSLIYERDTYC